MTDHRFSSFFWGIGLGATAALLCAPRPGVKTRALLAKKAKATRDSAHHRVSVIFDDTAAVAARGGKALKRTVEGIAGVLRSLEERVS